jgi:hypothetical protein
MLKQFQHDTFGEGKNTIIFGVEYKFASGASSYNPFQFKAIKRVLKTG